MAGVSYTFDLAPVSGSSTHRLGGQALDTSNASAGAQFQSVQQSFQAPPSSGHLSAAAPACETGGCFVVHGDGPGVTTLSIGEEDGGAGGYLALPMVDGTQFLEPPVQSFASAGDFDISTLAIGEEDGGVAVASAEIGGASQPISNVLDYVEQATLEPATVYEPAFSDGYQTASISESYGVMDPIYSTGDTVEVPSHMATAYAPYEPQGTPMQTQPIAVQETATIETIAISPQPKPASVASAGAPLPDMKPATTASEIVSAPTVVGTEASSPSGDFVSVGDYDSYVSSTGGSLSAPAAPAPIPLETPPVTGDITIETIPATPQPVYTIQEGSTAVPSDPVTTIPVAEAETTGVGSIATSPIEVTTTPQPTYVIQETAVSEIVQPELKVIDPASAKLPGPVSAQPQPVYTQTSTVLEGSGSELSRGTSFSSIDGPVPLEKPVTASTDAPRLSEEDYRITTLALGEEDAGGG